jgi:hypothetical protein
MHVQDPEGRKAFAKLVETRTAFGRFAAAKAGSL